jgi:hypothetical protein
MKFVPKRVRRASARTGLKLKKNSPTILVVGGVVGGVATVVMAVKASKKADVVIKDHKEERSQIGPVPSKADVPADVRKDAQLRVMELYFNTGLQLSKVYGPTLLVGTLSFGSILYGHKILHGRHVASVAAYTGLMEQFGAYRGRVRQTLGEKAELDIYNGAHGEYVEDPERPGEYKLTPVLNDDVQFDAELRPWFDSDNPNNNSDPEITKMWLTGVQEHMNQLLRLNGHLMLNDVRKELCLPKTAQGQLLGWVDGNPDGDGFIDFGFMTDDHPSAVAFRNGESRDVRLNFNVDGEVYHFLG